LNTEIEKEVIECVRVLRNGGAAVIPSATGWAVCVGTSNTHLVSHILASENFEYPAIILSESGKLIRYSASIPDAVWDIIEFSERPIHVFIQNASNPCGITTRELPFYIAKDDFTMSVAGKYGKPLLTANLKSKEHPEKKSSFLDAEAYVVNLRIKSHASTENLVIIKFYENGKFEFLKNINKT